MRYELTDLKLFMEIAAAGSLSTGASAVHITASSASYRLKNLEQALGTPLFDRTPRGMSLTQAGEAMLGHVRELFEGVERMHGEVGRFASGVTGHVRIAANSSALNGFATASIGRFLMLNPAVDAEIEERSSEAIPGAVLAREADIGIFAGPTESSGLQLHRYATDRLVIAMPAGHPLADQMEIKLGAALEFDFVCMSRASSNFVFLKNTAQRIGKPLRARLHAPSFDAVLSLVGAGLGVALVPTSIVMAGRMDIVTVPLADPWARRELNLAVRADGRLPTFAADLVQFLLADPRVAITRQDYAV